MDFHIRHTFQASTIYLSSSREHSYIPFIVVLFDFICPIVLLVPCLLQPVINGYRNKSTFSVNRGPDGNPKTVGYYLGTWRGQLKAITSTNSKPRAERRGKVQERCQWGWRGVENMAALKEKDEVFDAEHDHKVIFGCFLVGSHCHLVLGITTFTLSSSKSHMPEPQLSLSKC